MVSVAGKNQQFLLGTQVCVVAAGENDWIGGNIFDERRLISRYHRSALGATVELGLGMISRLRELKWQGCTDAATAAGVGGGPQGQ